MYLRLADVMVGEANEAAKQKKTVSKIIDLMSVQRPLLDMISLISEHAKKRGQK